MSGEPVSEGEASPDASPQSPDSLGSRAVSGSLWTGLRFAVEYGLRLVSSLILTRLLVPEAFGLMALVSVLMAGLAMFSDMGLASSVIQSRRGDEPAFLHTAWTLQVLRGFVLWVFAALFAEAMALVYAQPELTNLILVGALTAVINGFDSVALPLLRRHLQIRRLALIEIAGQFCTGLATILWAALSPSVWALVYGGLVGSFARMAISHLAYPEHRCRFSWNASARDELLHFGKWIFISTILFFLSGQADRLIFGGLLSISMLGIFSLAMTLAMIPTQIVWQLGNTVLFPALSRRADNRSALQHVYRSMQKPLLIVGALPVAGLAACASDLITVLYDPRYADAGWMLQILVVGTWLQVPQAASGSAVLAIGEPRWLAFANAMKFVTMLVALPLGYHFLGTPGAIAGLVVAEFARYLTLALGMHREDLPALRYDLAVTAVVGLLVAGGLAADHAIASTGAPVVAQLLGTAVCVGMLWAGAAAMIVRKELVQIVRGLGVGRGARSGIGAEGEGA